MPDLPWMSMNWPRFFSSSEVEDLPTTEARGVWALLLGKMWINQGWLRADDAYIAEKLGLDIRRWRSAYKPLFEPLLLRHFDPHIGAIYTQKTLTAARTAALDLVARNKARTERARQVKASKSKHRASVTEKKSAPVTETVTTPVAETGTVLKVEPEKERALPINKAESPFLPSLQGELASSGGAKSELISEAEAAAVVASLGHGGRSLPPPSPALLRTKIVKEAGNGRAVEADHRGGEAADPEPLPEPERAQRADAPAAGIFGALERARRKAEGEE